MATIGNHNLRKYGNKIPGSYVCFSIPRPVYREGPNRIIFSSLAAIEGNLTDLFYTPDNNEHSHKRKVIGQVVSDRSLRPFAPIINKQIDIFLRQLLRSSHRGEVVNLTPLCLNLSMDIACCLSFGYALNTQTGPTKRFIHASMDQALYTSNLNYAWLPLTAASPLLQWLGEKRAEGFRQFIRKMIVLRMAEPRDAKSDFYSVVAGDVAEVGGPTSGSPTRSAASPRKYLRAVVDESLAPLRRVLEASAAEPLIVDGHVIPRGTEVGIHLYSVLHDPDYYPQPFAFRPERWLAPDDETHGPRCGAPRFLSAWAIADAAAMPRRTWRRA
ncbi:cytochrome P450 [Hypoxylon cercidicola]|nr:cytochrome P450 [Hypoxylon cercidicola]